MGLSSLSSYQSVFLSAEIIARCYESRACAWDISAWFYPYQREMRRSDGMEREGGGAHKSQFEAQTG